MHYLAIKIRSHSFLLTKYVNLKITLDDSTMTGWLSKFGVLELFPLAIIKTYLYYLVFL